MKSLKAKLFVSIGTLFLLAGILNTFFADFRIKKELGNVGQNISEQIASIEQNIHEFASFLLTFHLVDQASELEQVALMAQNPFFLPKSSSLWEKIGNILLFNPAIAWIQIQTEKGKTAAITPEDAHFVPFSWAQDTKGQLWVQIAGRKDLFKAIPFSSDHQTYSLLFSSEKKPSNAANLPWQSIHPPICSAPREKSPAHLFESLLVCKNQWLQKTESIKHLLTWKKSSASPSPIALVSFDHTNNPLSCLLVEGILSEDPLIPHILPEKLTQFPTLFFRQTPEGKELDLVQSLVLTGPTPECISVGFSLTATLKEIALISQKTIIALCDGLATAITPQGKTFFFTEHSPIFQSLGKNKQTLYWEGRSYVLNSTDLEILQLFVLTPEEESASISRFLNSASTDLRQKISTTLIGAAVLSFLIALFLLHNISRKITEPISSLSHAAEQLGQGNYTDLALPEIGHRQDEVATFARSFKQMLLALQDRDKIQGLLNKCVSKEISQKILEGNIALDGEEKVVTLLFSDIRDFTRLAEGIPPHILIDILNAYMTRMCRIIDKTHGVVDKFIGDEIMTLYGAPVALDAHAVKAIDAALLMKEDLTLWNQERQKKGDPVFEIGIGIHTGLVYTGNMGAENRLNYTAIGANVNLASRLCSVAKPMQILISEDAFQASGVSERFLVKKLEAVTLKGIQKPIQAYEILGLKEG